ncbi:hypothetical protein [Thalassospira sp. MCCC 1A03138]|uniref:hypothetical protein n=1 Tax=Thalassospira sp. MCCC 1A03138 TaxID=1470576 RepID=UPI00111C387F|nr:hypothetical protein [Thalassospira sp. MCCC 1A03138]
MKSLALVLAALLFAAPAFASDTKGGVQTQNITNTDNRGNNPNGSDESSDETMEDEGATGRQNCYSARKCTGKILNHKDAHNCRNSGGKSWESKFGVCTNL